MEKPKKLIRGFFIVIIVLVLCIPCGLLIRDMLSDDDTFRAELYFISAKGSMKDFSRDIPSDTKEAMINSVITALKEGITSDGVQPAIPADVKIKSVEIDGTTAVLDFTDSYFNMSNSSEVICRSSLVWSLTSLEYIDSVSISVNGAPLMSKTGQEYGLLNRANVMIDTVIPATTVEYAILNLYFANSDGSDLVTEDRVVEFSTNQTKEHTVLEQLIAGPKEEGHTATVPATTQIKDVTTTDDGICYVNLSQDFIDAHSSGSTGELLTVYSIVNSLCELDNVSKVQFLVEGEKLDGYDGPLDFSTPFVAVNSIKTVRIAE